MARLLIARGEAVYIASACFHARVTKPLIAYDAVSCSFSTKLAAAVVRKQVIVQFLVRM